MDKRHGDYVGRGWKRWGRVRDYALLKVLEIIGSRGPIHGYGILKHLEEELGIRLSPGLLYPILRRLVDMGLATASEVSAEGKRVVAYEVTPMGREFLERRRSELEDFEKRALRAKRCEIHKLMARLRHLLLHIGEMSEEDIERLRRAVERFLEETSSLG